MDSLRGREGEQGRGEVDPHAFIVVEEVWRGWGDVPIWGFEYSFAAFVCESTVLNMFVMDFVLK